MGNANHARTKRGYPQWYERIWILAWALVCLAWSCCVCTSKAFADIYTSQDGLWEYTLNSDSKATIWKYKGNATEVQVPPNDDRRTITGTDGTKYEVVEIGFESFMDNTNLTTLYIYGPVATINGYAFKGCNKLAQVVNYSDDLSVIGQYSFAGCTSLTSIRFPGYISTIGAHAFSGCTNLASVSFAGDKSGVWLYVNDHAFEECDSLTEIAFPRTLFSTGGYVFNGCDNLRYVAFMLSEGSDYHYKNENTLAGCNSLYMVAFSTAGGSGNTSPQLIGAGPNVIRIVYDNGTDGNAIITDFLNPGNVSNLSIPNHVGNKEISAIGDNVFEGHAELVNVSFEGPCYMYSLGKEAFKDCINLKTIAVTSGNSSIAGLPSTITHLGSACFRNCKNLTGDPLAHVNPSGSSKELKYVPQECFWYCASLEEITIPSGVEDLGPRCFQHCGLLRTVTLPNSVQNIQEAAFGDCVQLVSVRMPDAYHASQDGRFTAHDSAFPSTAISPHLKFTVSCGSDAWLWLSERCGSTSGYLFEADAMVYDPIIDLNDETVKITQSTTHPVYDGTAQVAGLYVDATRWHCNMKAYDHYNVTSDQSLVNAGTYTIHITGDGVRFSGTRDIDFVIDPANVSGKLSMASLPDYDWDSDEWRPVSTWKYYIDAGILSKYLTLTEDDYTLTYSNNTDAGTGTVTVNGKGDYTGSQGFNFTIRKRNLATDALVEDIADTYFYTGTAITPKPAVHMAYREGTTEPVKNFKLTDTDPFYDIKYSYENNTGPGTAIVVIKPYDKNSNVTGEKRVTFTIHSRDLSEATIAGVEESYVYTGSDITPTVTVSSGDITFEEGKDYDVTYTDNRNVGTARMTITGKGGCTGTQTVNFQITPHDISRGTCDVVVGCQQYVEGQLCTPDPAYVEVINREGATLRLQKGVDYTIKGYENNDGVGTAKIFIKGMGNFTGENEGMFEIVSDTDLSQGYFALHDYDKVKTYAAQPFEPTAQPYLKGVDVWLIKDVDYTLAYENNVNVGTATVRVIGAGSLHGELSDTFVIEPAPATVTACDTKKIFDDDDPAFTAELEGIFDADKGTYMPVLEFSRAVGESVGIYAISVGGEEVQGNYRLTYASEAVLTIEPAPIGNAEVAPILAYTYTGKPFEPKPQVTYKSMLLREGVDYELLYANNVEAGTAHVTITGKGNFTGARTEEFQIVKPGGGNDSKPTPSGKGTLTFNLGGGTIDGKTSLTIEASVGDVITMPAAPTREGYTFLYWKGSMYYPGDKYTVTGDHTFTAVWKKDVATPSSSSSKDTVTRTTRTSTPNTADATFSLAPLLLVDAVVLAISRRLRA